MRGDNRRTGPKVVFGNAIAEDAEKESDVCGGRWLVLSNQSALLDVIRVRIIDYFGTLWVWWHNQRQDDVS